MSPAEEPRFELQAPGASPEEAAAIAAALEQHFAQNALAPSVPEAPSRWLRAALHEGVDHAPRTDLWT